MVVYAYNTHIRILRCTDDGEDGGRRLWSDSKSELDDEAVGGRRLGNEFISYLDDGAVGGRHTIQDFNMKLHG
ncbi:hypothetical protein DPMN_117206 [Dreissena polymorpha]|uniref:Uncharacterized protein n=1 Tax=Dreissena polymorpha TaxID=45954 RepID=A0A9D4KQB8_DREPO|nr:hypothetical protein DPMN_117206 [Dreissena polymorpha]